MSKRAGAVSAETKQAILAAAREEFSAFGFPGSSLRRIAAAAGVTTGAVYFFFDGKEDLFRAVLSQITEPLQQMVDDHYASEREPGITEDGLDNDLEVVGRFLDLYFENSQVFDIFLRHMDHPAVQSLLDGLTNQSTEHYLSLLQTVDPEVDSFAVHLFVHMQLEALLTLISHGFTREEARSHAPAVIRMLRGAFQTLLKA